MITLYSDLVYCERFAGLKLDWKALVQHTCNWMFAVACELS